MPKDKEWISDYIKGNVHLPESLVALTECCSTKKEKSNFEGHSVEHNQCITATGMVYDDSMITVYPFVRSRHCAQVSQYQRT